MTILKLRYCFNGMLDKFRLKQIYKVVNNEEIFVSIGLTILVKFGKHIFN
jgi:hypothetical protein